MLSLEQQWIIFFGSLTVLMLLYLFIHVTVIEDHFDKKIGGN